jgi:hypothetical protein
MEDDSGEGGDSQRDKANDDTEQAHAGGFLGAGDRTAPAGLLVPRGKVPASGGKCGWGYVRDQICEATTCRTPAA